VPSPQLAESILVKNRYGNHTTMAKPWTSALGQASLVRESEENLKKFHTGVLRAENKPAGLPFAHPMNRQYMSESMWKTSQQVTEVSRKSPKSLFLLLVS
jgi:hypothetical protein